MMEKGVLLLVVWALVSVCSAAENSVNFKDPDEYRNVSELVTSRGYGCENHKVITEDGYILSLQRILPINGKKATLGPVLLQHGLLDSAASFVINYSPSQNLAFILSDEGYDVWLGNSRGNTYSMAHVELDVNDDRFWNFSFDDMAKYDLPACIDYILGTSNKSQLSYVGHSQGTLILYAGLQLKPELASKIKVFQALAPITFLQYVTGFISELGKISDGIIYHFFGRKSFGENSKAMKVIADVICNLNATLCAESICVLAGCKSSENYNNSRLGVLFSKFPAGTSVKNIVHFKQLLNNNKGCRMYDYGPKKNKEHYGIGKPPVYNVTSYMAPPMSVFSGGLDKMADPDDVESLIGPIRENGSNSVVFWDNISDYGHGDFIWGLDAHEKVYPYIVEILHDYDAKK